MTLSPQMIGAGVGIVIVVIVMSLRLRAMTRSTEFNPTLALIYPVVLTALGLWFVSFARPQGVEWLWLIGALIVGGGLGWLRASTVRMSVDPATGKLMAQAGATAIVFLVGLLVVRYGLRALITSQAGALGIRLIMADVAFVALGVGLFVARSAEMVLRGCKLLAIHAANPAISTSEAAGV